LKTLALSSAAALAELDVRWASAVARITPEAIATGKHGERHEIQIQILRCLTQNLIFMCSRRAGKSEVCCGLLLLTAIKTPDVSCLYLALTKDSAEPIWRKWKKLLKKFNVPNISSDSEQYTEFHNGSRVLFTGTDDTRRITHLLGDQLAGGIAIIDESQDDPGLMERVVEDVLGPMLDETTIDKPIPGRLVLSGSIPDVPAGYFWRTWEENFDEENDRQKPGAAWGAFAWSRYENPFQTNNEQREADYCRKYGYSPNDPEVLRRFRGKRVFSKTATAYRFDPRKHTYRPKCEFVDIGPFHCRFAERSLDCDRVIVGIDQAQRHDRFAFVAWTWSHVTKRNLWQLAECVTDPGADPQESEWLAICAALRTRYSHGTMEFVRDAGGSSAPVNDALKLSHGIVVVSALKTPGSLKARVQRLSDLLALDSAKVIEGGFLADDLSTARWSIRAREAGKWELDKAARSPDVCDAASYALDLPSYTQVGAPRLPEKRLTLEEHLAEEQRKTLEEVLRGKVAKPKPIPTYVKLWLPPK
jgi:hypothetical protein